MKAGDLGHSRATREPPVVGRIRSPVAHGPNQTKPTAALGIGPAFDSTPHRQSNYPLPTASIRRPPGKGRPPMLGLVGAVTEIESSRVAQLLDRSRQASQGCSPSVVDSIHQPTGPRNCPGCSGWYLQSPEHGILSQHWGSRQGMLVGCRRAV